MPSSETALAKTMARVLRERGAWAVKTHGDPRQRRGLPDILFCYRGYGGGIEVKLPTNKKGLTPLQAKTLNDIKKAGGIGIVATRVSTVEAMLDRIDEVKDG